MARERPVEKSQRFCRRRRRTKNVGGDRSDAGEGVLLCKGLSVSKPPVCGESGRGYLMKFREAVHQATLQAMEKDPTVFLIGVGIIDPRAVWGTLAGALEKYGPDRVVEGPLAEDALTGMCIGAAMAGLRPVLVHHRIDFVMLTMNQLINHAAKWPAMF